MPPQKKPSAQPVSSKGKSKGKGSKGKGHKGKGKSSTAEEGGERRWKVRRSDEEIQEPLEQFRPIEEVTFDGGRAAVLPPSRCEGCSAHYAVASCLVTCTATGKVPFQASHQIGVLKERLAQTVSGAPPPPFMNLLDKRLRDDDSEVFSVCYRCYGKEFKGSADYYLKNTARGGSVVSSEFTNLRKKTTGRTEERERALCAYLYEKAVRDHPEHQVSLHEAYLEVCDTPELAKAADFIVRLGPDCYIQCCCVCGEFPANPKNWLRCVTPDQALLPGGTMTSGHWRCPRSGCCLRWVWATGGAVRALILPDLSSSAPTGSGAPPAAETAAGQPAAARSSAPTGSGAQPLRMVLIGECTQEQESIIMLLKAATLLQETRSETGKTVQLGIPALVRAIGRLNEAAEKRLLQAFKGKPTKACDLKEIEGFGVTIYCEDERLSLRYPGTIYNSIRTPEGTETISNADRDQLLDTLVCFFDLEHCKPKNKKGLHQAWLHAKEAQTQHQHRIFWTEAELQAKNTQ